MYRIYYSVAISLRKEVFSGTKIRIHHISGFQESEIDRPLNVEKIERDSLKNNSVINDIKDKYMLEIISVLEICKVKNNRS